MSRYLTFINLSLGILAASLAIGVLVSALCLGLQLGHAPQYKQMTLQLSQLGGLYTLLTGTALGAAWVIKRWPRWVLPTQIGFVASLVWAYQFSIFLLGSG